MGPYGVGVSSELDFRKQRVGRRAWGDTLVLSGVIRVIRITSDVRYTRYARVTRAY